MYRNQWGTLARSCIFRYKVTRESVSGTTSHATIRIRYYKSLTSHLQGIWTCNEIEGSYDKMIITIVSSYTRKNITRLLPLALLLMLRTCNNTNDNKLVIFSGIALYYGDNDIYVNMWVQRIFSQVNNIALVNDAITRCLHEHTSY